MTIDPATLKIDQLAPHSIEAESAVLGAALMNPDALNEVGFLTPEDFFIVRHAWIFEAMVTIRERKEPIDFMTVVSELEQNSRLAEVGGPAYILSLTNKTPNSLNTEGYGRIVERLATRRRLIDAASQIARAAHSDETDIEKVLDTSQAAMRSVSDRHIKTIDKSKAVKDIAALVLAKAKSYKENPVDIRGMRTGLLPLDHTVGGFVAGRLYHIAGRPGMGKSSLLAQIATGLAQSGCGVLMFSLEMSEEDMVWRMACQLARADSRALELGRASETEFKRFEKAIGEVTKLPIWIDDQAGRSITAMRSIANRYQREHGICAALVDTMNRVGQEAADQYLKITKISHAMADWAHDSEYAVVSAIQLSRSNTQRSDKRPTLADIRDSGAIEEDADFIGGLHREYYYTPDRKDLEHLAAFYTLKNRYGPGERDCEMYYDAAWPGFGALEKTKVELNDPPKQESKDSLEAAKRKLKNQSWPKNDAVDIDGSGILLPTGTGGK